MQFKDLLVGDLFRFGQGVEFFCGMEKPTGVYIKASQFSYRDEKGFRKILFTVDLPVVYASDALACKKP